MIWSQHLQRLVVAHWHHQHCFSALFELGSGSSVNSWLFRTWIVIAYFLGLDCSFAPVNEISGRCDRLICLEAARVALGAFTEFGLFLTGSQSPRLLVVEVRAGCGSFDRSPWPRAQVFKVSDRSAESAAFCLGMMMTNSPIKLLLSVLSPISFDLSICSDCSFLWDQRSRLSNSVFADWELMGFECGLLGTEYGLCWCGGRLEKGEERTHIHTDTDISAAAGCAKQLGVEGLLEREGLTVGYARVRNRLGVEDGPEVHGNAEGSAARACRLVHPDDWPLWSQNLEPALRQGSTQCSQCLFSQPQHQIVMYV